MGLKPIAIFLVPPVYALLNLRRHFFDRGSNFLKPYRIPPINRQHHAGYIFGGIGG